MRIKQSLHVRKMRQRIQHYNQYKQNEDYHLMIHGNEEEEWDETAMHSHYQKKETRHLSAHNRKNGGRDLHIFKLWPQKYRGIYPLEKISCLKHKTSRPQNSHGLHTILCNLKYKIGNFWTTICCSLIVTRKIRVTWTYLVINLTHHTPLLSMVFWINSEKKHVLQL